MIDPFVLLAPILLLLVVVLLQFVGCTFSGSAGSGDPILETLNPSSTFACFPGFQLTVTGLYFNSTAVVQWNGANLPTTWVSQTVLVTNITPSQLETAGPAFVTVLDDPQDPGSQSINALLFIINPGLPNPVTFHPLPPGVDNNDPVNVFQNINFNGWIWYQDAPTQTAIYFDAPTATARTFTFVNGPRILENMFVRHFDPAGAPITITLTNNKGESAPPLTIQGGQFQNLETGWKKCAQTVTVTLNTPTDNMGIVRLTYLGPT
ncbi:MAG TPA: IPT/TIG domain-containing protein [Methylomirabilota bacterium]|jgi:hypothetical protein